MALNSEKTRLIEFGRHAVDRRARRGLGKPETFKFLGFTHICGQSRRGKFLLKRRTRRDRMRAKLTEIKEELRRRMHQPIPEQGQWLAQVVRGFFAYITPCRPTSRHCAPSITTSRSHGCARYSAAARRIARRGSGSRRSHPTISRSQQPFIRGRRCALPSHTQGGSRVREFRSRGSVRGAVGNDRPYREQAGASCRSSNVRNAPLATVGPKNAACRGGPVGDSQLQSGRSAGLRTGCVTQHLTRLGHPR